MFQTTCLTCRGLCGIEVEVEDGRIARINGDKDHPITRGYICPKGRALPELVELSSRYPKPLKKNGKGTFEEIEWADAVDFLAERLKAVGNDYGVETVGFHVGQAGVVREMWPMMARLAAAFGTPNFSTAGALCHISKSMANKYTYGSLPIPDWENSRCMMPWGYNPVKSSPNIARAIDRGRENGAKLIVVDPLSTSLAAKADIHLRVRPGTDGALALGMLHVVISENLYDREFVNKWTVGFEDLRTLVSEYPAIRVETITGVPAHQIDAAARLFAGSKPAVLFPGNSLELQSNGFQTVRAISILQAICGNLDITGGARFVVPPLLDPMRLEANRGKPPIGKEIHPLFIEETHQAQSNLYPEAVINGNPYPLKALFVMGANPLLTWPNTSLVDEMLKKLEFLAVADNYMTPTAERAHLFPPIPTFLSRVEFWYASSLNGMQVIGVTRKVLDDDRPSDWHLIKQLGDKMGYSDLFPWESYEEWLEVRIKPLNISLDDLESFPYGKEYGEYRERKYEVNGFSTLSGNVEIYSQKLKSYGYNPLPVYKEPYESPVSSPETAEAYPLIITTGARTLHYMHSRHRDLPLLKKARPEPLLSMHPDKGYELGIEDGSLVKLESMRGKITVKVTFDKGIDPGVMSLPHGWWTANTNVLVNDKGLDPITGFPSCRAFLARVVPETLP